MSYGMTTTISLSNYMHTRLEAVKEQEEHSSFDSVIRYLWVKADMEGEVEIDESELKDDEEESTNIEKLWSEHKQNIE